MKIPKGGNQNLYIEEEQTTQWPKVKVQEDKQRSTKHTHKTKDRVTRNYPEMENTNERCNVVQFKLKNYISFISIVFNVRTLLA